MKNIEWEDKRRRNTTWLIACVHLGVCGAASAQGTSALPQPPVVLYGTVARVPTSDAVVPGAVTWSIQGNSESITTSNTTVVTVDSDTFYISRIPFETRHIVGGAALPATPNILELTQTDTTYTRTATVDGKAALLPAGKETFTYGASSQGLIDRIDLVIGESYEEWSQRIFGSLVNPNDDADGDRRTNEEEWLRGTDPQSASSFSIVRELTPTPGGGFTITWDSQVARTYTIEKSTTLKDGAWQSVRPPMAGTGTPLQYSHPASPEKRLFFRIGVSEP